MSASSPEVMDDERLEFLPRDQLRHPFGHDDLRDAPRVERRGVLELEWPSRPPDGAGWIDAYRAWLKGAW